MGFCDWIRSDLERQVEAERMKLVAIVKLSDNGKRLTELRQLATELGASTVKMYTGHGDAVQPELVQNIQQALQTKAMIAAVRTSSNYVIVSVVLALMAFGSMVAAFLAAFRWWQ